MSINNSTVEERLDGSLEIMNSDIYSSLHGVAQ
ncbi:unnamed protein product, partial [Rotaria magnacalcarata]